ncbi:MAG: hypothetical protein M3443_13685 [Actinomycetota bacterium]|nr:hypothetical protein [Actinomycetota bacterium]
MSKDTLGRATLMPSSNGDGFAFFPTAPFPGTSSVRMNPDDAGIHADER